MANGENALQSIDRVVQLILGAICGTLLMLTVVFTCYTVVMRYVFLNPPFWGDSLTLIANIWMVFLAVSLSVRNREQIAMQVLYAAMSPKLAFALEILWMLLTLLAGLFLIWFGMIAALDTPGEFWELGGLRKKYPMLILPLAGLFITGAAAAVLAEDWFRARRGDIRVISREALAGSDTARQD
jgi:TRAP-type C4-dicarboxylate transport system permease small subunit